MLKLLLVLTLVLVALASRASAQAPQPDAVGPQGPRPGQPPPGMPVHQPVVNPMPPRRPPPPFHLWFQVWYFPLLLLFWIIYARNAQQQAQAAQRQREEEEELKTPYGAEDLMENWEFKIVRNEHNLFDQPALLDEVLRDEARAGWQLVEKFDGNRLRLKRPAGHGGHHATLPADYDPYRTTVLVGEANRIKRQWRTRNLRIAAWVFGGCAFLALALGSAAARVPSGPGVLGLVLFLGTFFAGIGALIGAVALVVNFCKK